MSQDRDKWSRAIEKAKARLRAVAPIEKKKEHHLAYIVQSTEASTFKPNKTEFKLWFERRYLCVLAYK